MDNDVHFLTNSIFLARASSDDSGGGFVHSVEIVLERRHVHHAESVRVDQLDEHAVVANFCDYGGKLSFLGFLQLAFKELQQLDFDRFALGFGTVDFGLTQMLGEGVSPGDVVAGKSSFQWWLALDFDKEVVEYAMDDQVGVSTNGRGEVAVVPLVEPVVPVGGRAIAGFFHGSQQLRF